MLRQEFATTLLSERDLEQLRSARDAKKIRKLTSTMQNSLAQGSWRTQKTSPHSVGGPRVAPRTSTH